MLLAVWGIGSAIGGFWFGVRKPAPNMTRQFAWLLGARGRQLRRVRGDARPGWRWASRWSLGGATIAPALTLENTLVGRIAPAGMLNEAYTWVVTMSVAASAAGGAVAGLIVDHAGGVPLGVPLRRGGGRRRGRGRRAARRADRPRGSHGGTRRAAGRRLTARRGGSAARDSTRPGRVQQADVPVLLEPDRLPRLDPDQRDPDGDPAVDLLALTGSSAVVGELESAPTGSQNVARPHRLPQTPGMTYGTSSRMRWATILHSPSILRRSVS